MVVQSGYRLIGITGTMALANMGQEIIAATVQALQRDLRRTIADGTVRREIDGLRGGTDQLELLLIRLVIKHVVEQSRQLI